MVLAQIEVALHYYNDVLKPEQLQLLNVTDQCGTVIFRCAAITHTGERTSRVFCHANNPFSISKNLPTAPITKAH